MRVDLIRHPDTPSGAASFVGVMVGRERQGLDLIFIVQGDLPRILLPPPAKPYRADGLWQRTCFELFIRDEGEAYRELNFSPSSQWAAYEFNCRREGRRPLGLDEPPRIWLSEEPDAIMLGALVSIDLAPSARIGLSAVVEEEGGAKSYWALAHPPGGRPDFHHPDCFVLELPPAV